jgi:hypothetical protein
MSEASGRVIFVPVEAMPEIDWDAEGTSVQMHFFCTRDAITISLAMPAERLRIARGNRSRTR